VCLFETDLNNSGLGLGLELVLLILSLKDHVSMHFTIALAAHIITFVLQPSHCCLAGSVVSCALELKDLRGSAMQEASISESITSISLYNTFGQDRHLSVPVC
jgi:hypothetical protein